MIKIIIGILAVLLTAILLLQIDDDLHPDIPPILATYNAPEDNDAYFYLLGIDAPNDIAPITYGKQKLNDTKAQTELPNLPKPKEALFKHQQKEAFLASAFTSNKITEILEHNAVLLSRYEDFVAFKDYQSATTPSVDEPLAPYDYLLDGNKLLILKAILTAKTDNFAEAATLLNNHITGLRLHLKLADTLVAKIIYTALVAESIDTLSVLAGQANSKPTMQIMPLTIEEQSLQLPMFRELASMSNLMTSLDENPEFFTKHDAFNQAKSDDNNLEVPGWYVKLFFKPNMSVNHMYQYYKDTVALSELTSKEFASKVQYEIDKHTSAYIMFSIRNLAGNILTNIGAPNFEGYVGRVFDLNCKIALFNQMHGQPKAIPVDQITNPYYDKTATAFYSQDKKSICLSGPIDTGNDKDSRCLTLAY